MLFRFSMKKINVFLIIFRISCVVTFFYQAWISFEEYAKKKTLADIRFIKQDRFPLPWICLSNKLKINLMANNTFNITYDEYLKGKWKVKGLSEKELWDFLSPTLPNLIKKIVLHKTLENIGDKYSKVEISAENLPGFGVDIERKDYYYNPRVFCFSLRNIQLLLCCLYNVLFRKDKFPFGISEMRIYHKGSVH